MSGVAVASHISCAIAFTLATFILSWHRPTRTQITILLVTLSTLYAVSLIKSDMPVIYYVIVSILILGLIFISLLCLSDRVSTWAKWFISTHFFKLRYDYREEWMRFSMLLFENDEKPNISTKVIKAIADMVESPQGVLFEWEDKRGYVLKDCWNSEFPNKDVVIESCTFTDYIQQSQRALEFPSRVGTDDRSFAFVSIPHAIRQFPWAWLLVPLLHGNRLHAFVILAHPKVSFFNVNWEVLDLLYMAGRQAVICLVQEQNMQALGIARQFEGYNRLSAFVMHDLKNVQSQLKLIQANKEKNGNNPSFINSVYQTVDHAAEKIDRLLLQMRGRQQSIKTQSFDVASAMHKVIGLTDHRQPVPRLDWLVSSEQVEVIGEEDRFVNILCHLVENAQQATPMNGEVILSITIKDQYLVVSIQDTGCGMEPEFLTAGLYKPFVTTKGEKGTGIGVYEAREYVYAVGGRLGVETIKDKGSIFRLEFPFVV